jgi:hypothetical protein
MRKRFFVRYLFKYIQQFNKIWDYFLEKETRIVPKQKKEIAVLTQTH